STAAALEPVPAKPVVELFTSQGCSSCPPADRLLEKLAARDDVIALTQPVDYWDYLGWRDKFGKRAHTVRQKHYAMMRRDGEIYTPQMVVNGRSAVIGSRKRDVAAAVDIAHERARASVALELGLILSSGEIRVTGKTPEQSGGLMGASVWLLAVKTRAPVTIRAGENRGAKITYVNVVRRMTKLGTWSGERFTHTADAALCTTADDDSPVDGCVVIVQVGDHGAILGARALPSLFADGPFTVAGSAGG
ncbi:MAG: DUF1223 domain-containing protein, partial [Pseudomonadota bacterium]